MNNQLAFIAKVKNLHSNEKLVSIISEVLSISADAAYRRINGKTVLSYDEAIKLAQHFNISIDNNFRHKGVFFDLQNPLPISNNFEEFTNAMLSIFESDHGNTKIYYAAKDIPFYYFALLPELATFKLYYWANTIQFGNDYKKTKFNFQLNTQEQITQIQKFSDSFTTMAAVEIWNDESFQSILLQIQYYNELGYFESVTIANHLYDTVLKLIDVLETQCEEGLKVNVKKGNSTSLTSAIYKFYYNPVLYLDNSIIIEQASKLKQMLPFNAVDYLVTTDIEFISKNLNWFNKQLEKSLCYSQQAEKERRLFFTRMRKLINSFKK